MQQSARAPSAVSSRQLPAAVYRKLGDRIFVTIVVLLGSSIIALALMMAWVLWQESALPIRQFGVWGFLRETTWDPVAGIHGAWPFILGTLVTSFCSLALAFFPAIGVAIFSAEYAPRWVAQIINYTVDLLAAIPSVVIGIWGIFVFAPWMRDTLYMPFYFWAVENVPGLLPALGGPQQYNLITATVILSFMIVPYMVALTRDAIRLVPKEQREAAWALGATRWEVMRMAVLPYARGGIVAGAILALARALGETMAVAMLVGNSNRLPFTLFGPAATMPSVIVNEFREAVETLH